MTDYQLLTAIVSIAGAVASWAAYLFQRIKAREDRVIEMSQEWSELGAKRELFWTALRNAYRKFRLAAPHAPESLDGLIAAAGVPCDLSPRTGRALLLWPTENADKLGPDQRLMWEFVAQVYPPRNGRDGKVTDFSSIDAESAVPFHDARGAHAHFWKRWAAMIAISYLCKHYASARFQLIMLCWLEIALVQWTQDSGEGKTALFRFAQRVSR